MLYENSRNEISTHYAQLPEPGKEPDITRGTLEGTIRPGEVTIFRLQSTAECVLKSYIAQGEVIDINPKSFGGIGVFAIKEMARFYRYVLIGKDTLITLQ